MLGCTSQILEFCIVIQNDRQLLDRVIHVQNDYVGASIWPTNLYVWVGPETMYGREALMLYVEIRKFVLKSTMRVGKVR